MPSDRKVISHRNFIENYKDQVELRINRVQINCLTWYKLLVKSVRNACTFYFATAQM